MYAAEPAPIKAAGASPNVCGGACPGYTGGACLHKGGPASPESFGPVECPHRSPFDRPYSRSIILGREVPRREFEVSSENTADAAEPIPERIAVATTQHAVPPSRY
jgi:hypothetical protein